MTVTSVSELRDSRTGTRDLEGMRSYRRVYQVVTNNSDDGPVTILKSSSLPSIGEVYKVGNDRDILAICEKLTTNRNRDNKLYWEVIAEYATQSPSNPNVDPNNPTTGDGVEPPTVEISYAHYVKVAEKGKRIVNGVAKDWSAITNSALVPYVDPPIEKDDSRLIIRISRSLLKIDESECDELMNTINSDPFKFKWRNFDCDQDRYTVKLSALSADLRYGAGVWYWRVSYEFHCGDWYARPLDMGLSTSDIPGGGASWTPPDTDQVNDGIANIKNIKDVNANPVQEPQLLDGDGKPLAVNTFASNAVYLQYQIYEAKAWNSYGITKNLPFNVMRKN